MTIDPKNKKILLTSIPRDYYVQLHGTKGYKDKLTHSGIYSIQMTKNTLEDLFDIKIDYTIKVGFQSVIQLVDTLGGIDIDSDASFKSHCGDGGAIKTDVVKGINHFNGGQALSYARERYAYKTGDNHRVQNQQQVLEAIINKITTDKSLLKRYDKILDSLKETYRTDIPSSYIRLLVNNELDNMSGWTIERQQVSGSGSMDRTYSMPSVRLYVMKPDINSINSAKNKINEYFKNNEGDINE
jgi:LCP family protein required for cell wall assembly